LPDWTPGATRRRARRHARLELRRALLEEQLLMTRLIARQVRDTPELTREWSDFLRRQLVNVRFRVALVEPSGHAPTDALHELALHEVAMLLRVLDARTPNVEPVRPGGLLSQR
jgi:hypothetical protein